MREFDCVMRRRYDCDACAVVPRHAQCARCVLSHDVTMSVIGARDEPMLTQC
jgi:hypothetical protein